MKKTLTILLFFKLCFVSSQTKKPVYYYDVNDISISEKLYLAKYQNKKDSIYYHSIVLENDTCYIQKLVKTRGIGRVKIDDFKLLNSTLNKTELTKKFSIIIYHPGKDRCNGGRALGRGHNQKFYKRLKDKYNVSIHWVHKMDTSINFIDHKGVQWMTDKNKVVEKLFFKYNYPCSSFVIINNATRKYTYQFGEYNLEYMQDMLKWMINKS